jgi:hypothetical protein
LCDNFSASHLKYLLPFQGEVKPNKQRYNAWNFKLISMW